MDTRLLEYFVTTAEELSVTHAATRLYAAQSTVSAGLRSLERELGVQLFRRTSRSMDLTPEGRLLLPGARAVLEDLEELRELATDAEQGLRGRINIGTFSAMQLVDLPTILGRFRRTYPLVDLHLKASPAGSTGLVTELLQGRLDLAFTALVPPPELEAWTLGSVPFVALVPPGDPLAHRAGEGSPTCTLAELSERPWVEVLPGFGNRVQLERLLVERGLGRRVAAEVGDLPSVPQYVAQGLGVAVIPDSVPTPGCVRLSVSDLQEAWTLRLAARPGATRRPLLRALIAQLTGHDGALGTSPATPETA